MVATVPRLGRNRDLVVMPEDLGLMAAFTGSRGVPARSVNAQTGGLTAAIGTLAATYAEPNAYYAARYPELASRGTPTRLLALGLTDTFGRVSVETYAFLADAYDVWLTAGVNMARDWRIVCRDRATFVPPPGATGCDEEDPARVAALGDPDEPDRDYAYEATVPEPVNMALLFNPQGQLVSKQVKAYLTPVELPGQLDLVPGDPAGLEAVKTPVGRLGFVTSKDAWMPDVTGRLDQAGTEILIQQEFFVGDTLRTTGPWAPDTLLASGYSDLLRHPSLKAMVLPELTGDVYDFSADAQSHIAVRPSPGGPSGRLAGQRRSPGLTRVQPYLAPDPVRLPLRARRQQLGAAGEAAVGAGTQQEGVLFKDIEVGSRSARRSAPRRRDQPIAPSAREQTNVDIAAQKKLVYAAWEEGGEIWTAMSRNSGKRFRRPVMRGTGQSPSVSVGRGGSRWLAYERADGRVVVAESNGRPQPVSRKSDSRQAVPDVEALDSDGAYVTYIDDQTGLFGTYGAIVGDVPKRLDQGTPVPLAEQLDNSWAPSVHAHHKQVTVAWADFRNYQWDIYARVSEDRADSFQPQIRVNDTPEGLEALNDSPQTTVLRGDPYVVWTDYRKRSTPQQNSLYDIFGARPAQRNQRLDGDGGRQVNAFSPSVSELPRGQFALAWQSHRGPTADIALRVVATGRRLRVDDAGKRNVNSWRPSMATMRGREVIVAWEDDRDGPRNIFFRTRVLP